MTEHQLIARVARLCATLPANGFEPIGDDCTVLPAGDGRALVFTTDLLTEGVHFLRRTTPPYELGRKALAVNLSDVAAMGARPVATLLSLALPPETPDAWIDDFLRGYGDLAREEGVALAGGDTTSSRNGVTINVTAMGEASIACLKRRRDAREGDILLVTGSLGASAAGLRDLLAGRADTPCARRHNTPAARTAEGAWLGTRSEVHAMMDLSDGLAGDVRRILEQSHAGAEIDLEKIPVAEGSDLRTALTGGEDYELLLTAAPGSLPELATDFEARFGLPLRPVGRITAAPGIVWLDRGQPVRLEWRGYEHNSETAEAPLP